MALSPIQQSVMDELCEKQCAWLRGELGKLASTFIIAHDDGIIEVYGEPAYKAYVPKRCNGIEVKFIECNITKVTYDLDQELTG